MRESERKKDGSLYRYTATLPSLFLFFNVVSRNHLVLVCSYSSAGRRPLVVG